MKDEAVRATDSRIHKVTFPWPSALGALALVTYLLFMTEAGLLGFYGVPVAWLRPDVKYAAFTFFIVLLLVDVYRYHREYKKQNSDLQQLRRQIDDLWQSKKQLQLKAHTYSGHADKLKLFISDKLLNYIEYDEKFLHFKSIAAEVRHNGVISFDKVQTALHKAAEVADTDAAIQDAQDAMRYLWDLLDLSTADNLSLHVGNLLCECEEHYYQRMLHMDDDASVPFDPVYPPQRAAWRALALASQQPLPATPAEGDYSLVDNQWYVRLAPASDLLGNENHLVLLVENLLKNAQFFSSKRGYKSPFASVAMTLQEHKGHACLRVYNRGPHISDEDRPNLFQLGYSTRRARANHGRGLGLYFVNEIVKGYEGRIIVRNIHTPEARYTVRVELENGDVVTDLIQVAVSDGQPQCGSAGASQSATREWAFKHPICSVEVTVSGNPEGTEASNTQRLTEFDLKGKQTRLEPVHPERPRWQVHYQPKRYDYQLVFEPLDISGVEFEVQLPTAQQRLEASELELHEDIDAEVERLDERFRAREA